MSDSLEFRLLRYIVAIAETANITRAAERLFLAQPSLSKQIRDLEDELGFPIFERTRDGVKVTPSGEMVVTYAKDALRTRDELVEMARAVHLGAVPPLRLGFSSFVNDHLLQAFRDTYCGMFPNCDIQLAGGESAQLLQRINQRSLDCAILVIPIDDDRFQVQQMAQSPVAVCMRSDDPLATETQLDIHEIVARITVFPDPEVQAAAHARMAKRFEDAGIQLNIAHSASTPNQIQWMVKAGYGLALVEQNMMLATGLTTRPIIGGNWTIDTGLIYRNRADHLALSFIVRSLTQSWQNSNRKKKSPDRQEPQQMRLLA